MDSSEGGRYKGKRTGADRRPAQLRWRKVARHIFWYCTAINVLKGGPQQLLRQGLLSCELLSIPEVGIVLTPLNHACHAGTLLLGTHAVPQEIKRLDGWA